jgi:hypothetical protein
MVHSSAQQFTNPIEFSDETNNAMAIDPFTALKRPRSSTEDENSNKGNPRAKKNSPDVLVVVSDGDYDTEPEKDDYMITVDKWKNFPKAQRRMV